MENENDSKKKIRKAKKTYKSNVSHKPGSIVIKYTKTNKDFIVPVRQTDGAAAYDVYSPEDIILYPMKVTHFNLGFKCEIPKGQKLELYSRSGLTKKGVWVANQPGKIDSDYRGEMGILLTYMPFDASNIINNMYNALRHYLLNAKPSGNLMDSASKRALQILEETGKLMPFEIKKGDRIGQIEVASTSTINWTEQNSLSDTDRGAGGFGSTGE